MSMMLKRLVVPTLAHAIADFVNKNTNGSACPDPISHGHGIEDLGTSMSTTFASSVSTKVGWNQMETGTCTAVRMDIRSSSRESPTTLRTTGDTSSMDCGWNRGLTSSRTTYSSPLEWLPRKTSHLSGKFTIRYYHPERKEDSTSVAQQRLPVPVRTFWEAGMEMLVQVPEHTQISGTTTWTLTTGALQAIQEWTRIRGLTLPLNRTHPMKINTDGLGSLKRCLRVFQKIAFNGQ